LTIVKKKDALHNTLTAHNSSDNLPSHPQTIILLRRCCGNIQLKVTETTQLINCNKAATKTVLLLKILCTVCPQKNEADYFLAVS